jgi:PAS domain S-box-containing protein
MGTLKQKLSYLILGQKGGLNRIQIMNLLKERPYNLNQISEILKLNYRTIKHHMDILLKNELVNTSKTGSYGEVYFLSPEMEGNMEIFNDIVDKFEASNKIRDFASSPKFFQNVMEQTNEAVVILNNEGQIFFWNDSAEKLYGYEREEIIGEPVQILSDSKLYNKLITKAKKGEKVVDMVTQIKHISGNLVDVSVTVDGIKDEHEKLIGYSIMSSDITERKRAEEALRHSEERYALAQRAANIGSWDWDIINGKLEWSDTIEPMFGFGRGMFGRTYEAFLDCVHPEDRQSVIESVNACMESGEDYNIEHRIIWPDGTERTVSETGDVFRDRKGKPKRMLGIVQDITDRKISEERQNLTIKLLKILNRGGEEKKVIDNLLILIKEFTGFNAVAIRLKKDNDYPYFITEGFPQQFIDSESELCSRDDNNELILDTNGRPYLECMCGNVITGRTDPTQQFFTDRGSFWTNSTTKLLNETTEEDRLTRTRNRCNDEGFESVALIPLKVGDEIVGLLQLNDRKPDRFSMDMIQFFEGIGASIGIAFSRLTDENGK